MVIAGAALIKGAKSQKITSLDIGGPEVHVHQSGCADVRVPDDETLLDCLRREVARLPSSAADFYRGGVGPCRARCTRPASCAGSCPPTTARPTTPTQVLARLVDQSLFWELMPEVGEEMICRRRPGRRALRRLRHQPPGPGRRSRAPRAQAARGHPLPRRHRQDQRVLARVQRRRHPAHLAAGHQRLRHRRRGRAPRPARLRLAASSTPTAPTTTPMFTVLLRKASGAGYYAMSGLPYDPVVQLSTCLSRLSVMEGRTLAIATYNTKLDDDFQHRQRRPRRARQRSRPGMREVEAAHRARHGSVRGRAPDGHRRDRRARRAARAGWRRWSR